MPLQKHQLIEKKLTLKLGETEGSKEERWNHFDADERDRSECWVAD